MEAPEFFQGSHYCSQFQPEKPAPGDHFIVEDLLDFSNDEAAAAAGADAILDSVAGHSADSSTVTVVDSCNSSSFSGSEPNFGTDVACRNLPDSHFSGDLCVPCDDLAELEWLSNFVEESFSSEDLQKLQLISGMKARSDESSETRVFQPAVGHQNHHATIFGGHHHDSSNPIFNADVAVPAKARSKRSRAAQGNWVSRLLVVSPSSSSTEPEINVVPTPMLPTAGKKPGKTSSKKKAEGQELGPGDGEGRKCLHCATDKTPQWRTGPMGPKTLCNACGVRYKSGRLVPEYRPAASPTFVLTKHSNSHRKVMELRRQKELLRAAQQQQQQQFMQHHHQSMLFDVSNGDDYLIHQHVGPDFRQLI